MSTSASKPPRPDLVARAIAPDYALGPHTASLGLAWSPAGVEATLPERFRNGMFVGQHGSWNRQPRSGYRVIFVPIAWSRRKLRESGRRLDDPQGSRRVPHADDRIGVGDVEPVADEDDAEGRRTYLCKIAASAGASHERGIAVQRFS